MSLSKNEELRSDRLMLVHHTDIQNVPQQICSQATRWHDESWVTKSASGGVAEVKALESAQKANKLITDATKGIEEQVN